MQIVQLFVLFSLTPFHRLESHLVCCCTDSPSISTQLVGNSSVYLLVVVEAIRLYLPEMCELYCNKSDFLLSIIIFHFLSPLLIVTYFSLYFNCYPVIFIRLSILFVFSLSLLFILKIDQFTIKVVIFFCFLFSRPNQYKHQNLMLLMLSLFLFPICLFIHFLFFHSILNNFYY